jgi:hypothetical protein
MLTSLPADILQILNAFVFRGKDWISLLHTGNIELGQKIKSLPLKLILDDCGAETMKIYRYFKLFPNISNVDLRPAVMPTNQDLHCTAFPDSLTHIIIHDPSISIIGILPKNIQSVDIFMDSKTVAIADNRLFVPLQNKLECLTLNSDVTRLLQRHSFPFLKKLYCHIKNFTPSMLPRSITSCILKISDTMDMSYNSIPEWPPQLNKLIVYPSLSLGSTPHDIYLPDSLTFYEDDVSSQWRVRQYSPNLQIVNLGHLRASEQFSELPRSATCLYVTLPLEEFQWRLLPPKMKELDVYWQDNLCIEPAGKFLNCLTKLTLTFRCGFPEIWGLPRSLKNLFITVDHRIEPDTDLSVQKQSISRLFTNLPNLLTMQLNGGIACDETHLFALPLTLQSLVMDLGHVINITKPFILERLTQLRTLNIGSARMPVCESTRYALPHLHTLECGTSQWRDSTLQYLPTQLTSLTMRYPENMNIECFQSLPRLLQKLIIISKVIPPVNIDLLDFSKFPPYLNEFCIRTRAGVELASMMTLKAMKQQP